jgi:hypothetical protein
MPLEQRKRKRSNIARDVQYSAKAKLQLQLLQVTVSSASSASAVTGYRIPEDLTYCHRHHSPLMQYQ